MSFILDALRKSENERQKKATPGIADIRYAAPRSVRSRWAIVAVVVLALNAVLIAALLLRDDPSTGPPARVVQPAAVPPAVVQPARKPAQVPLERTDVRPLEEEVVEVEIEEPQETTRPVTAAIPTTVGNPPAARPGTVVDSPPSMQQLVLDGRLELQPLRLDMHVYSEQPRERFVFINMNKYREGDTLKEGPRLEEITRDGAVLSHQGNRFSLDR